MLAPHCRNGSCRYVRARSNTCQISNFPFTNLNNIFLGDVILGVNGDSFTDMGHHDAVKYLSALRGSIRFDLENAIEADIDEVCDMDTRFYQFHITETEQNCSDANQTR